MATTLSANKFYLDWWEFNAVPGAFFATSFVSAFAI